MGNGTKTIYHLRLNKGYSSKFPEGYLDRQEPDDGRSAQRPKRYGNNMATKIRATLCV